MFNGFWDFRAALIRNLKVDINSLSLLNKADGPIINLIIFYTH